MLAQLASIWTILPIFSPSPPLLTSPTLPIVGTQKAREDQPCSASVRRETVRFLDTGSICMEGASAHIAGRGCSTIRWKLEEDGAYLFFCETRDTCDLTHTGDFVAWPAGLEIPERYAADSVFCVDNNYTLLYRSR